LAATHADFTVPSPKPLVHSTHHARGEVAVGIDFSARACIIPRPMTTAATMTTASMPTQGWWWHHVMVASDR